jgi:hypothetical protein
MTEYTGREGTSGKPRGVRRTRLAEVLAAVLRDLVMYMVEAEMARPSETALEALDAARRRTSELMKKWIDGVKADGVSSETPFHSSSVSYAAIYASPDDVIEIREALLYRPVDEMWQLCDPNDLKNALNLTAEPVVVGFAGRVNRDALALTLARDQPVWTTSGSNAGLLRLVSLRPEYVSWHISAGFDEAHDLEPS